MIPKKTMGWILIGLGLLIIAWGLFSTYNIFTGKKSAPEVFKIGFLKEPASLEEDDLDIKNFSQEQLQKQTEKMIGEKIKEIIPQEAIYKILNLISWSIFATILFFGGGKISIIGVAMLKS